MVRSSLAVLLALLVPIAAGCSASPQAVTHSDGAAGGESTIDKDTTWTDGTTLSSAVLIKAGATVTIAAGATIHVANGVQISVQGTLKSAGGAEATLTADTPWQGILVDQGGTLSLTNVDIANTLSAISVNAGAASVTYDQGTISASKAPFAIQGGGKLSTTHAFVKGSLGTSRVQGEFDASYLDYDSNGNDGITAEADTAVVKIDDSELHGGGGSTADMIVSYLGAQQIHVAYTEIKGVHCAFHIERVTNLDVSFVNATGDYYGAMLYGSLATGTRTFDSVNFTAELQWGVDEENGDINGPITFTNSYIAGNTVGDVYVQTASNIVFNSPAAAPIANAKPR